MENLKELFPSESNPVKIIFDASLPKIPRPHSDSLPDKMLSYAATSTDKKKKKKDEDEACTYDEDGNPTCVIQAEHRIDSTVPGFVNVDIGETIRVSFKDNKDAKLALSEVLNKKNCGTMIEKLFGNLKPLSSTDANPVRKSNILELFDELAEQAKGGLFFNSTLKEASEKHLELNPGGKPSGGGGGLAFSESKEYIGRNKSGTLIPNYEKGAYMYVYIFPTSFNTYDYDTGRLATKRVMAEKINFARLNLVARLIHEMAHAAGKNTIFLHGSMDEAAIYVDPDLGKVSLSNGKGGTAPYFDEFLRKHCGLP